MPRRRPRQEQPSNEQAERRPVVTGRKRWEPLTPGQRRYLAALESKPAVICHGSAGTGKTWLAIGYALREYRAGNVDKILMCRPLVEAGERLGALPGGVQRKIEPHLRAMTDVLSELAPAKEVAGMINAGDLEMVPLAYMRGLTFHRTFMILDEAQNATIKQVQMFASRIGDGSRLVICGDERQSDFYSNECGLTYCVAKFAAVPEVGVVQLGPDDVVRSGLARILMAALGC